MKQISEPLTSKHKKSDFHCGIDLLNRYLHKQAGQDIKRKLSVCFAVNDHESDFIKGYYTLSNCSIPLDFIPFHIQKKLPKSYKFIPAILLGRLAIDKRYQGQGFGKLILVDALKRCFDISKRVSSFAVVVDPIDSAAKDFYLKYGFIELPDSGKMFLGMKTIIQLFD